MSNGLVERLAPQQWRRYRAIRLRALEDAPDAFARTLAEEEAGNAEMWTGRLERARATLVVRQGAADVGVCVLADAYDDPDAAGLYSVWVAPESRGTGVGDLLVGAAVECARSWGKRRVLLDVGDHNVRARSLYRRHGFALSGRVCTLPPPRDHIEESEMELVLRG